LYFRIPDMPKSHLKSREINPPVSRFRLQIRPSPIHCLGIFAREAIPGRRLVMEYAGDRITRAEAQRRFLKRGKPERICFARLNRRWVIDGCNGNGSEFINHSCQPNLDVRKRRGHILFYTRRAIRPGEELTSDYKLRRSFGRVAWYCGSSKCRGEMNRPVRKHRTRLQRWGRT
jgi:SET domain-containing protein